MPETLTVLKNVRVLDVHHGALLETGSVVVRDDRIVEVGPEARMPGVVARIIDGKGMIVMPGLIDGHVHVTAATADLAALAEWSPFYVAAHSARLLRDMLSRGFTTVRDTGGADYGLAAAVEEGLIRGPRLIFGGKALSQTGGHGDMRGRGRVVRDDHPCCPNIAVVCDGVDEVRKVARDQLRTGASHIKLMLSGGVASPTDRVESTQFSLDEIRAAVGEAHAAGAYVAGHAYTAEAIDRALSAGVRSIEHGNLLEASSIELFLQHGAFYVPTLVTYDRLSKDGPQFGLPAASFEKVSAVLDRGLGALEMAHRAGVNIVFGTDLLGGMQIHQLDELRLRSEVQPPIEIIRSATVTAARLLHREGEVGSVTVGALADLILVDGNPLEDLGVLLDPDKRLRMIMKGGVVHRDRTQAA